MDPSPKHVHVWGSYVYMLILYITPLQILDESYRILSLPLHFKNSFLYLYIKNSFFTTGLRIVSLPLHQQHCSNICIPSTIKALHRIYNVWSTYMHKNMSIYVWGCTRAWFDFSSFRSAFRAYGRTSGRSCRTPFRACFNSSSMAVGTALTEIHTHM